MEEESLQMEEVDWNKYFDMIDFVHEYSTYDTNEDTNKTITEDLACVPCEKKFKSSLSLMLHVKSKHMDRPVSCWMCPDATWDEINTCTKSWISKRNNLQRWAIHCRDVHNVDIRYMEWRLIEGVAVLPCPLCNETLNGHAHMKMHMSQVHPKVCVLCFKSLSEGTNNRMKQHYQEYHKHKVEELVMEIIEKSSKNKKLTWVQNPAMEDVDWDKYFEMKDYVHDYSKMFVQRDINTSAEALTSCKPCGKIFKSILSLNLHVDRKHLNPVRCWICDSDFGPRSLGSKFRLTRHCRNVHNVDTRFMEWTVRIGITQFPCPICGEIMNAQHRFYVHMKEAHSKFCKFCFSDIIGKHVRGHVQEFHLHNEVEQPDQKVENLQCLECKTLCLTRVGLQIHTDRFHKKKKIKKGGQNTRCHRCKINFFRKEDLSLHAKGTRDDLFMCGVCSSVSGTECIHVRHLRSHVKAKCTIRVKEGKAGLLCNKCGKFFEHDIKRLKQHLKDVCKNFKIEYFPT